MHSTGLCAVASDILVILTTFLVLTVPGGATAVSLGLRPATAVAAAPALTLGLVTIAGSVASYVEFPWSPLTFALETVLACGAILLARVAWNRFVPSRRRSLAWRPRRPSAADLGTGAGIAGGWILSAVVFLRGFGSMNAPNQDWDNVFHASALRLIADTGDVAPSALRSIIDWEVRSSFYPNALHGLGAVVRDLTGAPVFSVLNAQTLMIAGAAGLGLAVLLRSLGAPTVVCAATPVLLAGFASFPYDVIWRGPLLPYSTGIALIPAFFVLLSEALDSRRIAAALAAGLTATALLGVQTSTALSAALIVVPMLAQRWIATRGRTIVQDLGPLVLVGSSAVVLAFPFVIGALSMSGNGTLIDWPAVESVGQSVGDLFLLNHAAAAPQYWLSGLMVLGLLTLSRVRYMWGWLAGGMIAFGLFVLAASSDSSLVQTLTAPWWNDRWRFAAVAVLAFAPLAAAGLLVLAREVDRVLRLLLRRSSAWDRYRLAGAALLVLLAVFTVSHGLYQSSNEARVASAYQTTSGQLSATEVSAMRWLADQPGTDGRVMNDPNDGSPYMSAEVGLHPLFGHIISPGTAAGETQRLLLDHFNCIDSSPEVRSAVQSLDIRYVFTSGGYVRPSLSRTPGLVDLSEVHSLEQVYAESGVRIYRVHLTPSPTEASTACTLPPSP
jgi:hypothetical protein